MPVVPRSETKPREHRAPSLVARTATAVAGAGLTLAVAGAPIALGAVHTWAVGLLVLILVGALAAVVIAISAGARLTMPPIAPAVLLTALAAIGALQTIPLPRKALAVLSPARATSLDSFPATPAAPDDGAATLMLQPLAELDAAAPISYQADSTFSGVVQLLVYLAVFVLGALLLERRSSIRRLVTILCLVCGTLATLGLVLKLRSDPRLLGFITPPPTTSTFASYVNRNHFAGLMELCLPLAVGLSLSALVDRSREPAARWLQGLVGLSSATTMAAALLATQSRAGVLGMLAGTLVLTVALMSIVRTRRPAIVLVLGMVGLVAYVSLLDRGWAFARLTSGGQKVFARFQAIDPAFGTRAAIWRGALAMATTHPGLGVGLGAFETPFVAFEPEGVDAFQPHAESDYLTLLAESGTAGGLVAVLLLLACARRLAAVAREGRARAETDSRHVEHWVWMSAACASMVALLTHGVFDVNLHVTANGMLFWLLAAIALTRSGTARPARLPALSTLVLLTLAMLVLATPRLLAAARGDALYQRARLLQWEAPHVSREIANLQRAATFDRHSAPIHLRLGTRLAHQALVNPTSAESPEVRSAFHHLGEAMRLWPSDVTARFESGWLAGSWAERQEPPDDQLARWGQQMMQVATEAKPGAVGLRVRYGYFLVFFARDRLVEGLGVLRETIRARPEQMSGILAVLEVRLPKFLVGHAVPDVAELRYRYGRRLEVPNCDDAIAEYERALALAAPFPDRLDAVRRLVAERLDALQFPERSLPLWNRLLESSPVDSDLLRASAVALLGLGLADDATRNLEEALRAVPEGDSKSRVLTQDVLARLYYRRGECRRTRELLAETDDHLGLYLRGNCELAAGDLTAAHKSFTRLVTLEPGNERVKGQLAQVERRMAETLR